MRKRNLCQGFERLFCVRKSDASAKKRIIMKKKSDASGDNAKTNGNGKNNNRNKEESSRSALDRHGGVCRKTEESERAVLRF